MQLSPGANIQSAIASNSPATTFCLADGEYTTTVTINPKDGDRFIGVYTDGTQPNIANTGSGGVFYGGRGVLYQDIGVGPSSSTGMNPGTGSTLTGVHIHDNKGCGINTAASYLTVTGSEIGPNNGAVAPNSCGIKIHGAPGLDAGAYDIVTNNIVHDNIGQGLRVDCDGHDNLFSGNQVYGNTASAIDDETSYNNTFANNAIYDNGFGWSSSAVSILDSIGTKVTGNTFTHNYKGFIVWKDKRATLTVPQQKLGCADVTLTGYIPSGIVITGNNVTTSPGSGFPYNGAVPVSAAAYDYNCWTVPTLTSTLWKIPKDATATWSQWLRVGQDPHGRQQTEPC